jgi:DNA-binding transcriptional LysR family regulator
MAIHESRSTTKAGQELALSQSAVSTGLKDLETQLNVLLFDRVGRRLNANRAGKMLAVRAKSLLSEVQEIEQLFSEQTVVLHIGASTTIGTYLLPKIIASFIKNYPNVEITLHVHNSKRIIQGINDIEYDLGFIEGLPPLNYPNLTHEAWKEDKLILFGAANSKYFSSSSPSIIQLQQAPLILREFGSGTRAIIEQQFLDHIKMKKIIEIGHSEAIKQSVLYDLGIGCLSTYVVEDLIEQGKLKKLNVKGVNISRTLWQIRHKSKYITPALENFIRFVGQI